MSRGIPGHPSGPPRGSAGEAGPMPPRPLLSAGRPRARSAPIERIRRFAPVWVSAKQAGHVRWAGRGRPRRDGRNFGEDAAVGFGQGRLQDRGDIGAQMFGVAGAEQHDIDPRFVPHKAVGGFGDRRPRRLGCSRKPSGWARRRASAASCARPPAAAASASSRPGCEKMLRTANISSVPTRLARVRGKTALRAFWCIIWNATMTTSHIPSADGALQHRVPAIARPGLGDAEMPQLALLVPSHSAGKRYRAMVVGRRRNAVQLEDIDIVGAELAQRVVEARRRRARRRSRPAARDPRLGGRSPPVARHRSRRLAEDRFGPVDGGGIEQIDAEIERLVDEGDRPRSRFCRCRARGG